MRASILKNDYIYSHIYNALGFEKIKCLNYS